MSSVLVIDDHLNDEIDFKTLFAESGLQVHIAFGKEHGFAIAQRYIPDIIISNLETDENGCKLLSGLISNDLTQSIPIIFLSTNTDNNFQRQIMNNGADDFLLKPIISSDLIASVKCRLRKLKLLENKISRLYQDSIDGREQISKADDHVLVNIGNRLQLIKYNKIVCVTALKEYSKIHTFDGQNIIVRKSLKSWIYQLPAKGFLRIHRSSIINVEAIEKIKKVKERTYVVYLKSMKEPLEFSQRYSNIMRKTFPS